MPRAKLVKCKGCGRRFKKSELSRAGYCKDCRLDHMSKVIKQLYFKKGYYYHKWRKNWLKSKPKLDVVIRQLREKRGPYYDRWRRAMIISMQEFIARESSRLGRVSY